MDIYGNKLGNHALPNIFLSFCPSLSPVDTLDVITLKWLLSVTMVRRRHMHSLECCRYINYKKNQNFNGFKQESITGFLVQIEEVFLKCIKMMIIQSPLCSFCRETDETIEHIFWDCDQVQSLLHSIDNYCMNILARIRSFNVQNKTLF